MRAAKAPIMTGMGSGPSARKRPAVPEHGAQTRNGFGLLRLSVLFSGVFFFGYLIGIFLGRNDPPDYGTALAQYYMDGKNYTSLSQVFSGMLAGAFLQVTLVFLCGFSVWGTLFLAAFFAAKGALMGMCASCVFVAGGARSLVIYWLLTCLPDISVLVLEVWLSLHTAYLSGELFRCVFGGATRSGLLRPTKHLMIRYLLAVLLGAVCCGIGAAGSVVFAGVLL